MLRYIPEGQPYGFDRLMLDLIKTNKPPAVIKFDGYWLDIGRPDDYTQAIDEFENFKDTFLR